MRLDAELGRKRTWSHVVELWLWTSQYEPTGDLSGLTDKMIADVSGWRGNAPKFVAALRAAGFLDDELCLVGWEEHQAAHVERAEPEKPEEAVHDYSRPWRAYATEVHDRDGWACRYCGDRAARLTLDHVSPKSQGGTHGPDNLVTACGSCNSRKGARTPDEARMTLIPLPHASGLS